MTVMVYWMNTVMNIWKSWAIQFTGATYFTVFLLEYF
jgi:hypothetical protein